LDERPRGEVLAGALLAFAGGFFEQALERRALHVHVHGGPIFLINHGKKPLQIDRIVKARNRLGENIAQQPAAFPELAQDIGVVVGQRRA